MSKEVKIPISSVDKFISDGTYVGLALRYRLKNKDSGEVSQWSSTQFLKFLPYYSDTLTYQIAKTNGYTTSYPSRGGLSYNYGPLNTDSGLPASQIDQVASQVSSSHNPQIDSYKYSWSKPVNCNIKNFDVYTSWNIMSYVCPIGTLSAPSGTGPYTGTLQLSGTGSTNANVSLKTFYDVTGATNSIKLFAGPGTATPGNTFVITGYTHSTGTILFNVQSASTWTATGTIKNISRSHGWTDFEYVGTTNQSSYIFDRKMKSNKLTATITSGSCLVQTNESLITSGVVPGMILVKKSGDGKFAASTATISQIDYTNNIMTISPYLSSTVTASTTGTIGTVTSNTATITGMSGTSTLYVGAIITATAGTGNFGSGTMKVTSIPSSSSITVSSTRTFTAGTVTNILQAEPLNHTASGYIEFVAATVDPEAAGTVATVNTLWASGGTNLYADSANTIGPIQQYFLKPMSVQAIAMASTEDKPTASIPNSYTLFAISEAQSTYFDGYGVVGTIAGTGPYTARLTNMSLPYTSSIANVGARLYAETGITGAVPLGAASAVSGETKIADYVNGVRVDLMNTTTFTAGTVVSLRL
jgi:hypothetical protein